MPDDALRRNRGRQAVAVMDPLFAGEQERETDRIGDVAWIGWREFFVGVGHLRTITRCAEQIKNIRRAETEEGA